MLTVNNQYMVSGFKVKLTQGSYPTNVTCVKYDLSFSDPKIVAFVDDDDEEGPSDIAADGASTSAAAGRPFSSSS